MKRSTDRILVTHAGSLARPKDLLEMMDAKLSGRSYDQAAYGKRIRNAVADMVRNQVQCGIDIVTDGEQSKPSFNAYLIERLTGFEAVASSEERIAARTLDVGHSARKESDRRVDDCQRRCFATAEHKVPQ